MDLIYVVILNIFYIMRSNSSKSKEKKTSKN